SGCAAKYMKKIEADAKVDAQEMMRVTGERSKTRSLFSFIESPRRTQNAERRIQNEKLLNSTFCALRSPFFQLLQSRPLCAGAVTSSTRCARFPPTRRSSARG